jgi:hypothetical protein
MAGITQSLSLAQESTLGALMQTAYCRRIWPCAERLSRFYLHGRHGCPQCHMNRLNSRAILAAGQCMVPLADVFDHKVSVVRLAKGFEVARPMASAPGVRSGHRHVAHACASHTVAATTDNVSTEDGKAHKSELQDQPPCKRRKAQSTCIEVAPCFQACPSISRLSETQRDQTPSLRC